jgi:hypothetical protein
LSVQCLYVGCALFFHVWLGVVLLTFEAVSSLSRIVDHCVAAGARVDCNAHEKVLPLEWNPFFRPHLQIPRYLINSEMHQRSQQSATDNAPQTSPSSLGSNSLSLPSHAAPDPPSVRLYGAPLSTATLPRTLLSLLLRLLTPPASGCPLAASASISRPHNPPCCPH